MDNDEKSKEFERPEYNARRDEVHRKDKETIDVVREAGRRAEKMRVYAEKERKKRRRERISRFCIVTAFIILGIALAVCCAMLIIGKN